MTINYPLPVSDVLDSKGKVEMAAISFGLGSATLQLNFRTRQELNQFKRVLPHLVESEIWKVEEISDTRMTLYNGGSSAKDEKVLVEVVAPEKVTFHKGITDIRTDINGNWTCVFESPRKIVCL